MRTLLLALLILPALTAARAQQADETAPVQRHLHNLRLGDGLEDARRIYPPAQEWPSTSEKHGVTRYALTHGTAKSFPRGVETLYLGFQYGKLVEIEAVYDEVQSRAQTVEMLAGVYALDYGAPKRSGERFWWSDGKTVLRVFPAELPDAKGGENAVVWRTAVQIFDKSLAGRAD